MWWTAVAWAGPAEDAALVGAWLRRDGVRYAQSALDARADADCSAGSAVACALRSSADLLPAVGSALDPAHPSDPARYRALVEKACDAGVARGCTEVGEVHLDGIATYASASRAGEIWLDQCKAGEPHACARFGAYDYEPQALERAIALGDPTAWLALADLEKHPDSGLLIGACRAGVTEACWPLARLDPEADRSALDGACALGDPPSSALALELALAHGELSAAEVRRELGGYCPASPDACEAAALLDQGVTPRPSWPGSPPNPNLFRVGNDLGPPLHRCYLDALARDPTLGGTFHAVILVDKTGHAEAAFVPDPLDPGHRTCVEAALRAARYRAPDAGEQRLAVSVPAFHGARVQIGLQSPTAGGDDDATRVEHDTAAWRAPVDECLLRYGVARDDLVIGVDAVATVAGRLTDVEVTRSSGSDEADRCLVDWLSARALSERPLIRVPIRIELRPLGALPDDPGSRPVRSEAPPVGPAPTTEIRLLVIAMRSSVVDGARAKGAVTFRWELKELDGPLTGAFGDQEEGESRWKVYPADVPDDVIELVGRDRYDSLMVWVPIPRGFPQPDLGTTWLFQRVGGASFSSFPYVAGAKRIAVNGAPEMELPLHEWWHQVQGRAWELGAEVPDNHQPLEVGDVTLDPRNWLRGVSDTMAWYEHVVPFEVHPELWHDAWAPRDREIGPDHVFGARADRMFDRITSDGGFGYGADVPTADHPLGAAWEDPVGIRTVAVRFNAEPGASGPVKVRVRVDETDHDFTVDRASPAPISFALPDGATVRSIRIWGETDPTGLRVAELELR
jgi:hypothetical protein